MAFNQAHHPHWQRFAIILTLLVVIGALPASSAPHAQEASGPAFSIKEFDGCRSSDIYEVNSMLLFFTVCPEGYSLWRSDGTTEGTQIVTQLPAYPYYAISTRTTLFFWFNINQNQQLWNSDGTTENTTLINSFPLSNNGSLSMITMNDVLYFILKEISPNVERTELWKSDGTIEGTILLKQLASGSVLHSVSRPQIPRPPEPQFPSIAIRNMALLNNSLLFILYTPTGNILWRSDGTPETTTEIVHLPSSIQLFSGGPFNGAIFLLDVYTGQLWRTDGTTTGTVPLDMFASKNSSGIGLIGQQFLFLQLYIPVFAPDEMYSFWSTNGTAQCTFQLSRFPQTPISFGLGDSSLLVASYDSLSVQLWKSDGTPYGTRVITDLPLTSGDYISSQISITHIENDNYLILINTNNQQDPSKTAFSLWRSDGTAEGTILLQEQFSLSARIALREEFALSGIFAPIFSNGQAAYFWVADPQGSNLALWKLPRTVLEPGPEVTPTPNPDIGMHTMLLPLVVDQC